MSEKHHRKIEISELIDGAVNNAMARRNQALENDGALTDLSQDEVEAIRGGLKLPVGTTAGIISVPEETM